MEIALESLLPAGIRLRPGKKVDSLIIQTRKKVVDAEGKQHVVADARTIKLSCSNPAKPAEYAEAFKIALAITSASLSLDKTFLSLSFLTFRFFQP